MQKNDKVYRIVSIVNFWLHILLFTAIVIVGFLPFRAEKNFYQVFDGFFGSTLSVVQPYCILMILLVACVCAFWAIKKPALSVVVLPLLFSFFSIVVFPYTLEASAEALLGGSVDTYQIGFDVMNAIASYEISFAIAFTVYAFVTLIVRRKKVV